MKKAITILAVLIVLVGAVFAAETHTVKIRADVTSIVPVFGLQYTYQTTTVITNTTTQITSGADAGQWNNAWTNTGAYATNNTEATAVDTGLKLDKGGDVYFYAMLLNPAKEKKNYTLTFKNGVFEDVPRAAGTAEIDITPDITISGTNQTTGNGFSVTTEQAPAGGVFVKFDGKQVSNPTKDIQLATAKYTYSPVADVDMPAGEETYYYADVVLEVTRN